MNEHNEQEKIDILALWLFDEYVAMVTAQDKMSCLMEMAEPHERAEVFLRFAQICNEEDFPVYNVRLMW